MNIPGELIICWSLLETLLSFNLQNGDPVPLTCEDGSHLWLTQKASPIFRTGSTMGPPHSTEIQIMGQV